MNKKFKLSVGDTVKLDGDRGLFTVTSLEPGERCDIERIRDGMSWVVEIKYVTKCNQA